MLSLFSFGRLTNRRGGAFDDVLHAQTGGGFQCFSPKVFQPVDVLAPFFCGRKKDDGGVLSDELCFVSLEQRLIEAMPAQRAARLDDFLKSTVLAFAVKQRFTRAQAAAHDLSDEQAAATDFAEK